MGKPIEQRWLEFAHSLEEYRSEGDYSGLWASMIQSFEPDFDSARTKDHRQYSFQESDSTRKRIHDVAQVSAGYCESWALSIFRSAMALPFNGLPRLAAKFHRAQPKAKALYDPRIARILQYMSRRGIDWRGYLEQALPGKRIRPTFSALKSAYYADWLLEHTPDSEPERVLEIGAGAANFALILFAHAPTIREYFIVDLPEMILVGSQQLNNWRPEIHQTLPHEVSEASIEATCGDGRPRVVFLTPSQTDQLPKQFFDLAVNIESFGEMAQAVANRYVALLYDVLRPDGTMFTVNRESRIVNVGAQPPEITSFWRCPFRETDRVVWLDYCAMRDQVFFGRKRNLVRLAARRGDDRSPTFG